MYRYNTFLSTLNNFCDGTTFFFLLFVCRCLLSLLVLYLPYLQISMNVPALKQTSVTPTLSVATLKDRIPVAVV